MVLDIYTHITRAKTVCLLEPLNNRHIIGTSLPMRDKVYSYQCVSIIPHQPTCWSGWLLYFAGWLSMAFGNRCTPHNAKDFRLDDLYKTPTTYFQKPWTTNLKNTGWLRESEKLCCLIKSLKHSGSCKPLLSRHSDSCM